MRNRKGSEPLI